MYADFESCDYEPQDPRRFTVQQSSLATERKVWIGLDEHRAHLNVGEARIVRDALSEFLADGDAAVEAAAIGRAADWLEALREDTWNGSTRRPSNYGRAAGDLRRYAERVRATAVSGDDRDALLDRLAGALGIEEDR